MVAGRHIYFVHHQSGPPRAQYVQDDSVLFGPGGQMDALNPSNAPSSDATGPTTLNPIPAASPSQVLVPNPAQLPITSLPPAKVPSETLTPVVRGFPTLHISRTDIE